MVDISLFHHFMLNVYMGEKEVKIICSLVHSSPGHKEPHPKLKNKTVNQSKVLEYELHVVAFC